VLGRYTDFKKLGAGGMGVVVGAVDTELNRPVALKFLTDEYFAREDFRERFLREAQTAAAINHPNICTIHDVGTVGAGEEQVLGEDFILQPGTPFIAMELVEGSTLDRHLGSVRLLQADELLRIAIQIAEGLAAAHAKGIVHRDLKPANIMVLSSGLVKILGFGLAKRFSPITGPGSDASSAKTLTTPLTGEGRIVGTVTYMSPEQAQGMEVDSRSDVFSFGIILYEMASGRRPFQADSPASTMAKILETEPESFDESRVGLPPEFARIVHRCLRKKPDERFNDLRDLVVALKDLRQETSSAPERPAKTVRVRRPYLRWAAIAAGLLIAGLLILQFGPRLAPRKSAPASPTHRQITYSGNVDLFALAPGGQTITYADEQEDGGFKVFVQDIAGGSPLEVFRARSVSTIEWSPDGSQILCSAKTENQGPGVFLVPRLGGSTQQLAFRAYSAWSPDGNLVAGTFPFQRSIDIFEKTSVIRNEIPLNGDFNWVWAIAWSPGDRIAFCTSNGDFTRYALWTIKGDGSQQELAFESSSEILSPQWSPAGDAVYFLTDRGDTRDLLRILVDEKTGRPKGEPVSVLTGLAATHFSLSRDGSRLLYDRSEAQSNIWLFERDTEQSPEGLTNIQLTRGTYDDLYPKFSPDGSSVAFTRNQEIFVLPLSEGSPRQLTYLDSSSTQPAWSPDGREIAFTSDSGGVGKVWKVGSKGGSARPFENTRAGFDLTWAPGQRIVYRRYGSRTLYLLDPDNEDEIQLVLEEGTIIVGSPHYSPDGERVAVSWNRKHSVGIWVLGILDSSELKIFDHMRHIVGWSADGRWVYVIDAGEGSSLLRIPSSGGEAETVLTPPFENTIIHDISPDGKRLLAVVDQYTSDLWLAENFDPDLGVD